MHAYTRFGCIKLLALGLGLGIVLELDWGKNTWSIDWPISCGRKDQTTTCYHRGIGSWREQVAEVRQGFPLCSLWEGGLDNYANNMVKMLSQKTKNHAPNKNHTIDKDMQEGNVQRSLTLLALGFVEVLVLWPSYKNSITLFECIGR